MPDTQLPPDLLSDAADGELKFLMATGKYASEADAIAAAIEALAQQERRFKDFLKREVMPVYEEVQAHPERLIPAEEVFAELKARYTAADTGNH